MMRTTTSTRAAALLIGITLAWSLALPARAEDATATDPETSGQAALAERFATLAADPRLGWQGSATLLEAALRLDPTNVRLARLLADAMLQAGNRDGAVAALNACRKLDPSDQVSQARLIDLYVSGMETADARYSYLSRLVGERTLADEVRAHAGVLCARVLLEQSKRDQAIDMINQALHLDALNMEALRLRYAQLAWSPATPPRDRLATLLAMLRANPAEARAAAEIARELAAAGLAQPAIDWYALAFRTAQRSGAFLGPDTTRGYATELFIAGQMPLATQLADALVQADPLDVESWFLRLAIARQAEGPDTYAKLRQRAGVALSNRLALARQATGSAIATTRPADSHEPIDVPDLSEDVRRLNEPPSAAQRPVLLAAIADFAWFELYFNDQPAAAGKLIGAMASLLPETDPLVARLQGWQYVQEGKPAEATVKLSAVAQRDPLAALGLLRLQLSPASGATRAAFPDSAQDQAAALLARYPSGTLGLILWDSLRDKGITLVPPAYAATLREELDRFPKQQWLAILDRPQDFYIIRAEPLKAAHAYGEPILVRVTLQNISDFDVPIGNDQALHPDLWFDAQLHGAVQQPLPGVAYDRIASTLVLRARQGTSQIVRLDQGNLAAVLQASPDKSFQVIATVTTNPSSVVGKSVSSGPGGYCVQTRGALERLGAPLASEEAKTRLFAVLTGGTPQEKIQHLDLASAYVDIFRGAAARQGPDDQLAPLVRQLTQAISQARSDNSIAVQVWASFLSALAADAHDAPLMVDALAADKMWSKRMLSLLAAAARAGDLPPQVQKDLALRLAEGDPDPLVRGFAALWAQRFAGPATTQASSTQPTTQGQP